MRVLIFLLLLIGTACSEPTVGPATGSLLIHGGGRLSPETVDEFIRLAGGIDGRFVIIPTADAGEDWSAGYIERSFLRRRGARDVTVLHTRDRALADSPEFVEALTRAQGVWLDGGRQWRLADAYLGTRVLTELRRVLERGGVIGGSSAGATIQGSYMVRGAPEGNHVMMAPGHEEGFGFLRNSAIDQHVLTRKRENDLVAVIEAHPELLGFGIDENTALVVQGDRARVIGASKVAIYSAGYKDAGGRPYFFLSPGDILDLATRRPVATVRVPD